MKRDNIIDEVKQKDLHQLHEIMKIVLDSKTSYEEIKKSYEIANKNKNLYILGYYIQDNLAGTLTLDIITLPAGKQATIWNVAIKEEYRRLGIASKLMNKAEEIVRSYEGVNKIWLFSKVHRESAHELYRKLGYDETIAKAFIKEI